MLTKLEALQQLKACLADGSLGPYLEYTHSLVAILDDQGAAIAWNPAFNALHEAIPGARTVQDFLSTAARLEFLGSMRDVLQTGTPTRVQLEIGSKAARIRYDCLLVCQPAERLLFVGEPVIAEAPAREEPSGPAGDLQKLRAELQDTRVALDAKKMELQAVLAQADEVVHTGALTLLPNRRWIISDLQKQVTISERYGSPLTISMIDLDNFKEINDTFGHATGDQVLRYAASEMRDHIRQPDEIGRYGGDEFLVILPNSGESAATEQAQRLCRHIQSHPIIVGEDEVPMSLSIGIAQFRQHSDDWRTLLERADKALYQAKHEGRARWAVAKS